MRIGSITISRFWVFATLIIAVLVALAACSGMAQTPTADRQGPNGTRADGAQDMTHVVIYRAPDLVPNVAVGCLGAYGFMSTLKTGSTEAGVSSPSLARFPEYDKVCAQ
jgi:hypothetical protein